MNRNEFFQALPLTKLILRLTGATLEICTDDIEDIHVMVSGGKAEAEAIREKGIAEAEALEKKADAMAKYGRAAILEMVVNKLPEMANAIAKPLESIDKVTIIDGGGAGSGSGVQSMGGYVPAVLAKTIESIKETTGIDINEIVKADTYDAKVTKNLNVTGIEGQDVNLVVGDSGKEAAVTTE